MSLRRLLLVTALVLGVVPLAPPAAFAMPAPAARFLAARVAGAGRSLVTGAIRTTVGFDVAGLRYDGPPDAQVELRASRDGHSFTPWYEAETATAEGPDTQSREYHPGAVTTEPVWTGSARYVQYRIRSPHGPVRNLRPQAVDVQGHGESAVSRLTRVLRGILGGGSQPAAALTDQPAIVSRAQWGADLHIRRADPDYGAVQMAVVHHTDTGNDYTPLQARAVVRGIYVFHVKSNGWNDIGYNFLVDRFGTVYEGRYGGMDLPVIGAHTLGFNSVSTGVSLMGTFSAASPSPAMLSSLEQVLAWRLDVAHVDPLGHATVTSAGSDKYPQGAHATLNDISGHRDMDSTGCPGDIAYALLDQIRHAVAQIGLPKVYRPATVPDTISGTQLGGYATATISAVATAPMHWSLTVTHFALGDVRHLTAPDADGLAAQWDGTDDNGRPVPGGDYSVRIEAAGPAGTARAATVDVAVDNTSELRPATRLAGGDRYGTSAAVSRQVAPDTATSVIVASADNAHLVDSLVAAPLAVAKKGPLLLSAIDSLPGDTSAELDRLHPSDAYIVGGTAAVSDSVAAAITAKGITVHRVAGDDAPSTAAEVADAIGGPRVGAVVVARERAHLVDGLAASGPAAGLGRPVLLVNHDSVPAATTAALADLHVMDLWAVGGTAAISDVVVTQLHARRVAGDDRWSTAAAVAEAGVAAGVVPDTFVVASGEEAHLVDALSGGSFGKPVLLTGRRAMPKVTWDELYSHRVTIEQAWVVGGTGSIATSPAADVKHAINAL